MTSWRRLLLGCCCAAAAPMYVVSAASAADVTDDALRVLVERVDARYAALRDFQADFVQETRIEGFDTPIRSAGRVFLKPPGRLRWDYTTPSVEHLYVHHDRLSLYVPAHNQVVNGSLTALAETKAPLRLLQGAGALAEHFSVHPTADGRTGEGALPLLTLIPHTVAGSAPSSITSIVSEIQPGTYFIRSLALHERSGNVSTFRFSNFKTDSGLDDTVFVPDLPEDVVVVDDVLPRP